jgi:hypothetical protein
MLRPFAAMRDEPLAASMEKILLRSQSAFGCCYWSSNPEKQCASAGGPSVAFARVPTIYFIQWTNPGHPHSSLTTCIIQSMSILYSPSLLHVGRTGHGRRWLALLY